MLQPLRQDLRRLLALQCWTRCTAPARSVWGRGGGGGGEREEATSAAPDAGLVYVTGREREVSV